MLFGEWVAIALRREVGHGGIGRSDGVAIEASAVLGVARPRSAPVARDDDRGRRRASTLLGFGLLFLVVAPHHYSLGSAGAFTVGIGVTAYTLGMRHAFDADHIAAIDNTTRKLMAEGKRPMSVGFWFSLGHSTIVFGLAFLLSIGIRSLVGPGHERRLRRCTR